MGCWNETCGVTQLPINYGDKVRLFVLVAETHWKENSGENLGGGVCYSTDLWSPIGPPIKGEYDDYGGIENLEYDESAKLTESRIVEGWIPVTSKHEWDKVPDKLELSDYLELIERGRGFTNLTFRQNMPLGVMMVHEDVYQAMINFDSIEAHHYWNDEGTPRRTYEYMPLSKSIQMEYQEWYEKQLGFFKKLSTMEDQVAKSLLAFKLELGEDHLFGGYKDGSNKVYRKVLQALAQEFLPFESERVQKVVKDSMDLYRFQIAMSRARKMWTPQCGKGSQQNDLDIYKAIQAGMNKVIEARETYEREELGSEPVDSEGYSQWQREHNETANKGKDAKEGK